VPRPSVTHVRTKLYRNFADRGWTLTDMYDGGGGGDCGGYSSRAHWWCAPWIRVPPHTHPLWVVGGRLVRWCRLRYQRTLLNGGRATKTVVDDNVGLVGRRFGGRANGIGEGLALGVGDVGRQWFHAWDIRIGVQRNVLRPIFFFFAPRSAPCGHMIPRSESDEKNIMFFSNRFRFWCDDNNITNIRHPSASDRAFVRVFGPDI